MAIKTNPITQVCTHDTFLRPEQFGDVYRSQFTIDGVGKKWDILFETIPFSPEREARIRHLIGDDRETFYRQCAQCIANDIKIRRYLKTLDASGEDKAAVENLQTAVMTVSYSHMVKHEGTFGSDVYLVTDTAEPFVGSQFFNGHAFTLTNLAMFAARAAQILKGLDTYHVHIGAIDLDSVVLRRKDGKDYFAFSSFLYGGFDEGFEALNKKGEPWVVKSFPPTIPANADEAVRNGAARPSLVGDMHSLAALLWVILCGEDYHNAPNFDIKPQYAPDDLAELLKTVHESDDPDMLRVLQKELRNIAKKINRGDLSEIVIQLDIQTPLISKTQLREEAPPLKKPQTEEPIGKADAPTQKGPENISSGEPESTLKEHIQEPADEQAEILDVEDDTPAQSLLVKKEENAAEENGAPRYTESHTAPQEQPVNGEQNAQQGQTSDSVKEKRTEQTQGDGTAPPAQAAEQPQTPQQAQQVPQWNTQPPQYYPPYQPQPIIIQQPVQQPVYPVYQQPVVQQAPVQPVQQAAATPQPAAQQEPQSAVQQSSGNKQTVVRKTVTTYKPKRNPAATFFKFIIVLALLSFAVLCAMKYAGIPIPIDIPFIPTMTDSMAGTDGASTSGFTVTPNAVTLAIGEEATIQSSAACTLNSSNHNVATISDNGTIKAVGRGTCTITARMSGGNGIATVSVTVN